MRTYRIHDKIGGWVDLGDCFASWDSIPFIYFSFADYAALPDAEAREAYIRRFQARRFRVFGPWKKRRQSKIMIRVDRVLLDSNLDEFLRLEVETGINTGTAGVGGCPYPSWNWPFQLHCFEVITTPRSKEDERASE